MDDKSKIEKIMQVEKLNSAQFAIEIGIQGSTLSHILNGRNKPSLEVLKKIMNRFRSINPEWLILDVGTMYRQEKHSQTPTLFDTIEENTIKSDDYTPILPQQTDAVPDTIRKKSDINSIQGTTVEPATLSSEFTLKDIPQRAVKKVIIYYSDNTFEEFQPNR